MIRWLALALLLCAQAVAQADNECPTGTKKYFRAWVEEATVAGEAVCFQLWADESVHLLDVTVSTNTWVWLVSGYTDRKLPQSIKEAGAGSEYGIDFGGGTSTRAHMRVAKGPFQWLADGPCLLGQMRHQGMQTYSPQTMRFDAPIAAGRGISVRSDRPAMVAVACSWCEPVESTVIAAR